MTGTTSPAFAAPPERRLGTASKLFYGFGSVAFGVKDNGFSYLLLLFYNQVVGLPAAMVGLAILIAMLFDALIDPIVGQIVLTAPMALFSYLVLSRFVFRQVPPA